MKKTKFSDEKIAYILRQAEAGIRPEGTRPSKCVGRMGSMSRLSIVGRSDWLAWELAKCAPAHRAPDANFKKRTTNASSL